MSFSSLSRAACFLAVLMPLLCLEAPVRAQNGVLPQAVQSEWQAGAKALGEQDFDAAIAHFNRVVAALQKPEVAMEAKVLAEAFCLRADAHYGAQNWKGAVADYSRCIELDPKNADAYAYRGVARKAASQDYDGLLADAEIAAKLDPQYADLLDDAHSTVTWRRAVQGFLILGGIVLALGALPMIRSLARLIKAGG